MRRSAAGRSNLALALQRCFAARWHLDEMVIRIHGTRMYLWCAVDDEGEVLDMLLQKRRNKRAALRLMRRLGFPYHIPPK
jgi:putative transposase